MSLLKLQKMMRRMNQMILKKKWKVKRKEAMNILRDTCAVFVSSSLILPGTRMRTTTERQTTSTKNTVKRRKRAFSLTKRKKSRQRVVCQIGEGATSIAYKAIDERTNEEMCKKVLKVEEGKTYKTSTKNLKFFSNCRIQASAKIVIVNQSRQRQQSKQHIEDQTRC